MTPGPLKCRAGIKEGIDGERPLVSVIIPVYNYAGFLPDAINSVLNQAADVEIIVVDDGSTDNILGAISPFADRIVFLQQPNNGLSAARNLGISKAKGKYLLFLDADDILGEGVIAGQLAAIEGREGRGVAVCRNYLFSKKDAGGKPVPNGEWRRFTKHLDIHLCHFNIGPPAAFLVRRHAVIDVGGFDPHLRACEDHDLWLRLCINGHRPFIGAGTRVYYRRHPASMSRNLRNQHLHDLEMHLRVRRCILEKASAFRESPGSRIMACCAGIFLTATRLGENDGEPLLDPLLDLLTASLDHPMFDSPVYELFLARSLMLSRHFFKQEKFSLHLIAIRRCVERAGRSIWLTMPKASMRRMICSWEDKLYA